MNEVLKFKKKIKGYTVRDLIEDLKQYPMDTEIIQHGYSFERRALKIQMNEWFYSPYETRVDFWEDIHKTKMKKPFIKIW